MREVREVINDNSYEKEKHEQLLKERELLYKQFELLAEQSKNCTPMELAELSRQMLAIHDFLF